MCVSQSSITMISCSSVVLSTLSRGFASVARLPLCTLVVRLNWSRGVDLVIRFLLSVLVGGSLSKLLTEQFEDISFCSRKRSVALVIDSMVESLGYRKQQWWIQLITCLVFLEMRPEIIRHGQPALLIKVAEESFPWCDLENLSGRRVGGNLYHILHAPVSHGVSFSLPPDLAMGNSRN